MKMVIDATKCQGYGACALACPSVVEVDEWGFAHTRTEDGAVPSGDEDAAREAMRGCPEAAIALDEQ